MTTPRRRIIRRSVVASLNGNGRQASDRLPVLQARLDRERKAFDRWLSRLKRACHALEKQQRKIARLERKITIIGHS